MPLTRDFIETIRERAEREPGFRVCMLQEALSCVLNGEAAVGRILMRDYIRAVIGLAELSRRTGRSQECLKHMFFERGNEREDDLLAIIAVMAEYENVELDVQAASRGQSEQPAEA